MTLNAVWTPISFQVTLKDGENMETATFTYGQTTSIACPFEAPEGMIFGGWMAAGFDDPITDANLAEALLKLHETGEPIVLTPIWNDVPANTVENQSDPEEQENTDEEPIAPPAPTPNGENTSTPSGEETPTPNGEETPTPSEEETPTPSGENDQTPSGEEPPTPEGDSESGGADTEGSVDPTPVDTQSPAPTPPDPTPEVPSGEQSDVESPESHEE